MPTSTVENYLKAILLRAEPPEKTVPMGALAEALGVTPGTVTTMVKAMASRGLLEHQARQGVKLSASGQTLALAVLRKHRLIETFLVQVLKMDWAEVHEEAEALEHAISDRLLDRMDAFLGHPSSDPHGDPIPDATGRIPASPGQATLANCVTGKFFRVVRIADQRGDFLQFIGRSGLKPGARVKVSSRDLPGGVVHCLLKGLGEISIGIPTAGNIEVAPAP